MKRGLGKNLFRKLQVNLFIKDKLQNLWTEDSFAEIEKLHIIQLNEIRVEEEHSYHAHK